MKLRQGFVSNSSSSSFVLLLPNKFDVAEFKKLFDEGDYQSQLDDYEVDYSDVEAKFEELLRDKSLWTEEDYRTCQIVEDVLSEYVIASFDTPSDGGQMALADTKKVEYILGVE